MRGDTPRTLSEGESQLEVGGKGYLVYFPSGGRIRAVVVESYEEVFEVEEIDYPESQTSPLHGSAELPESGAGYRFLVVHVYSPVIGHGHGIPVAEHVHPDDEVVISEGTGTDVQVPGQDIRIGIARGIGELHPHLPSQGLPMGGYVEGMAPVPFGPFPVFFVFGPVICKHEGVCEIQPVILEPHVYSPGEGLRGHQDALLYVGDVRIHVHRGREEIGLDE